jgi:hypothetical protein
VMLSCYEGVLMTRVDSRKSGKSGRCGAADPWKRKLGHVS